MRILILGVAGMIGHKLWQALSMAGHEVLGTLHRGRADVAGYGLFDDHLVENFEAADGDGVTEVLDRMQPAVIVNCIGITKRKPEADDVARMLEVNALFPHRLARWAGRNGARIIHFSTDCVFAGDEGRYRERSVVSATDLYGQTKFFGELDYDHCLTIRTSMIGRELTGHTELLEWFLAQKGGRISGFTNAMYSGLTTNEMGTVVARLVSDYPALCGKYHVAGPVISKYELLCGLRDVFGIDVEIAPERGFVCDRTLRSEKFESATGIRIPPWEEMLVRLAAERVP